MSALDTHTDASARLRQTTYLAALAGRRSRRFGLGMQIPSGTLAYASTAEPMPLDPLERAILVYCASGATGYTTGMEHTSGLPDGELCTYPMRFTGKTAPSAAGIGASEVLITDDTGLYLTQIRESTDVDGLVGLPSLDESATTFWAQKVVQLSPDRLELPREGPHFSPHNLWNANVPGSTVLMPIVDLTEVLLDFLLIYLGTGAVPMDLTTGEPLVDLGPEAATGVLDLSRKFPYQDLEQYVITCGAAEAAVTCHNAVLALQGMGLGGWMFSGMDPTSLLGGRPPVIGAGFEFVQRSSTGMPVCVGYPTYFETYSVPWHASPEAAVDAFLERKYGPEGTYSGRFGAAWNQPDTVLRGTRPHSAVESALRKIAVAAAERFGTFPGTIPAVFSRFYAQAHHLDLGFYEKFYGPEMLLESHHGHHEQWHSSS